jgi:hypothetical protein
VRRLTFELSGPQRQGALAARPMINMLGRAAKAPCLGGSALERRVRRRCSPVARLSSLRSWELDGGRRTRCDALGLLGRQLDWRHGRT